MNHQTKKNINKNINKHKKTLRKNKKIFFIHIPKTAGTTIENVLYDTYKNNYSISIKNINQQNKNTKQIKQALNQKLSNHKTTNISIHHIPPSFFKTQILNKIINNHIIFAIVRNPYDRIISDFKFWIKYKIEREHKPTNKLTHKEKHIIKEITLNYYSHDINKTNLNKFVQTVLPLFTNITDINTNIISMFDGHLIPMHYYTHINNKKIKNCEILYYENLNNDFNKFIQKYKLNISQNILNNKKYMTNTTIKSTLDKSSFDEQSLKLIQSVYKLDFKYFNYSL
jgi:hypothetical protein